METAKGFVDIHCHILPGLDDGAKNMDDTLAMIDIAYREGIRTIVGTPHQDMEENRQDFTHVEEVAEEVRKNIGIKYPDMELMTGCEVLFDTGLLDEMKSNDSFLLGKGKYVLVEFFPSVRYKELYEAIRNLVMIGRFPVIAHVERYECLVEKPAYIQELRELGALIQVNSRSFLGKRMAQRTRFCKKILRMNCIHLIGTDCHNLTRRPPRMKETYEVICKLAGEERADRLMRTNALKILRGEFL